MKIKNIIFDFGGVLVDWNPRYLFKDILNDDEKMEHFLGNICTDRRFSQSAQRGYFVYLCGFLVFIVVKFLQLRA